MENSVFIITEKFVDFDIFDFDFKILGVYVDKDLAFKKMKDKIYEKLLEMKNEDGVAIDATINSEDLSATAYYPSVCGDKNNLIEWKVETQDVCYPQKPKSESENLTDYRELLKENRFIVLPNVNERDRKAFEDGLHDYFKEAAASDPSAGVFGMSEGETKLADSLMSQLHKRYGIKDTFKAAE